MSQNIAQNTREGELWRDFLNAVSKGDEQKVRRILEADSVGARGMTVHPFITRKIPKSQETVLHLAVRHSKESIITLLLEKGIKINSADHPHKCTALHLAVRDQDSGRIIQLLLNQQDINVNAVDGYGNAPVKLAAEKGNREAVKLLVDKGADITKADIVDNTAIHVAAEKGHYEVLQLLLPKAAVENPGIIGQPNTDHNTPLHLAVKKQCQKTVAMLLYYGASSSLGVKNQHNETPKQLAAGDKRIVELLENPSKATQQLQELFRPAGVQRIGRGDSVEADSGHHPVIEHIPQVTNSSLVTALPRVPGIISPAVIHVQAQEMNIKYEYNTNVHDGGIAAIGSGVQVNVGASTVTTGVCPQPAAASESSYDINMSGGNASIGNHSVTNVGTATPRTPSSAGSIEGPFMFPEHPENRSNRTERSSTRSAENASVGALPYPVLEGTSSGSPTENVSKPPGELPHPIPEVSSSKKASDSGTPGVLPYPVPEGRRPGSPTEDSSDSDTPGKLSYPVPEESRTQIPMGNSSDSDTRAKLPYPVPEESRTQIPAGNSSDSDTPGKLPYPVPEESRNQKAEEPVTFQDSMRDSSLVGEAGPTIPSSSDRASEAIEPSENTDARGTVEVSTDTTPSRNGVSGRNSNSERAATASRVSEKSKADRPFENSPNSRGVGKVPVTERSNESPGNARTNQVTTTSGDVGASMVKDVRGVSPSKTDTAWGSTLQKKRSEYSNRATPLSRAVPKDFNKHLLEISNSQVIDPAITDTLLGQMEDLDPASEVSNANRPSTELQGLSLGGTKSKAEGVEGQSGGTGKREGQTDFESVVRLNRVGLRGSPGPHMLFTESSGNDEKSVTCSNAGTSGDVLENTGAARLSSSSKEAPHKKERFLRDDSFPDGDVPAEESPPQVAKSDTLRAALAVGHNSSAGENRSEHETLPVGNVNSETRPPGYAQPPVAGNEHVIVMNDNPEDDPGGTKRCDNDCTIM